MGEMGCRADVMLLLLLLCDAFTALCAAAVQCDLTSPISLCPSTSCNTATTKRRISACPVAQAQASKADKSQQNPFLQRSPPTPSTTLRKHTTVSTAPETLVSYWPARRTSLTWPSAGWSRAAKKPPASLLTF